MALIELVGIERVFQLGDSTVHALTRLNLTIEAGEYVAVMGLSLIHISEPTRPY